MTPMTIMKATKPVNDDLHMGSISRDTVNFPSGLSRFRSQAARSPKSHAWCRLDRSDRLAALSRLVKYLFIICTKISDFVKLEHAYSFFFFFYKQILSNQNPMVGRVATGPICFSKAVTVSDSFWP